MTIDYLSFVANHLWQSTVVVGLATLLAFMLRNNSARIRYWIWFAAAMKFLIPFSVLISVGQQFQWRTPPLGFQRPMTTVAEISVPFVATLPASLPATAVPQLSRMAIVLFVIWFCGFAVSVSLWIRAWLHVRSVLRSASPAHIDFAAKNISVRVMSSPALREPAVLGILRPVLVIPHGISGIITPEQFEAIVIHEICHVRRHDNLRMAIHMIAETLFWFYPLLRWIETRLVEERERACDEEVLRVVQDPQIYADGIVNICKAYSESPLSCSAGVAGSDLKARLRAILAGRIGCELNLAKKVSLAAAVTAVLAFPLLVGILNASATHSQGQTPRPLPKFDAASIKLSAGSGPRGGRCIGIDSFYGANLPSKPALGTCRYQHSTLSMLLNVAYAGRRTDTRVEIKAPDWATTLEFDVLAKASDPAHTTEDQLRQMLQAMLADRFKVRLRSETRSTNGFALVAAKGGTNIKEAAAPGVGSAAAEDPYFPDMENLVYFVSGLLKVPVVDKTGITATKGFFLIKPAGTVRFGDPVSEPEAASIFRALKDQLGLQLESWKVAVRTYILEEAEKPGPN